MATNNTKWRPVEESVEERMHIGQQFAVDAIKIEKIVDGLDHVIHTWLGTGERQIEHMCRNIHAARTDGGSTATL